MSVIKMTDVDLQGKRVVYAQPYQQSGLRSMWVLQ